MNDQNEDRKSAAAEADTAGSDVAKEKAPTLEERFAAMDDILQQMDRDDVPLEKAFALYKSGLEQVQQANQMLDAMEQQLLMLNEAGELEDF